MLFAVSLLIPNIYATTANQQTPEIIANTSINSDTIDYQITDNMQYKTASSQQADEVVSVTVINHTETQNITASSSSKTSYDSQCAGNIQSAIAAAGDETFSNVQNNWFTINNITEAAGRVRSYIETNHKLPSSVQIGTTQVTVPQFLQLLTTGLIQVNKGNNTSLALKSVNAPSNTVESLKSGSIKKTEYLDLAVRIQSYINTNGKAPNYATSTLGKIGYPSLIYLFLPEL